MPRPPQRTGRKADRAGSARGSLLFARWGAVAALCISVQLSKSVQELWPGSAQTQGPSIHIEMATQGCPTLAHLLEGARASSEVRCRLPPRLGSALLQPVLGHCSPVLQASVLRCKGRGLTKGLVGFSFCEGRGSASEAVRKCWTLQDSFGKVRSVGLNSGSVLPLVPHLTKFLGVRCAPGSSREKQDP